MLEDMKNYAIYLHSNGSLIEKPEIVYKSDSNYFTSPFVMKVWYIQDDTDWKSLLRDAIIKGALPLEVKRVALEKGLSEKDVNDIWETPR